MRGQSYWEITEHWLVEDVLDANYVLNAIDNVYRAQQREAARQREQG